MTNEDNANQHAIRGSSSHDEMMSTATSAAKESRPATIGELRAVYHALSDICDVIATGDLPKSSHHRLGEIMLDLRETLYGTRR